MFVNEFGEAGGEGGGIVEDVRSEEIHGEGWAFEWLMWSLNGCSKCLDSGDVSGEVSADDVCFPEKSEK